MRHSVKMAALAAAAFIGTLGSMGGAQAESGYDYVFWPFFTPLPVHNQAPVAHPQARAASHDAPIRYFREAEMARPVAISGCGSCVQTFIVGVGY